MLVNIECANMRHLWFKLLDVINYNSATSITVLSTDPQVNEDDGSTADASANSLFILVMDNPITR